MKEFLKFIKSSGIYFAGTVMTKVINFLLLPIYTKYISPDDYGIMDLSDAYISFFCSVLFLDIWAGIMRFMFDYEGKERKKPINSGIVIFFISCLLYTIILWIVGPLLNLKYILLLMIYGILMNVQILVGYIARGYEKNILYTSAGIVGSFVTIIFNIILLVYFKMDYSALFISNCFGYITNIVIILVGLKEPDVFSLKNFDKNVFKELLFFSLPLCINSVAYWFLTSYNRLVVVEKLGLSANGYYAVAGRFGSIITLFTTCFQMAWQELAYSKTAKEKDLDQFYTVAINSYIKCMGVGLIILIPVIYLIYPIFVNEAYDVGKNLIPFFLMGTVLSTIGIFLGNAFGAIKKNKLLFWTMTLGSVFNVGCIHLLIPKIGIQASNISLMIGFFVLCISRIILFKKYIKIKIDYLGVFLLIISFAIVAVTFFYGGYLENICVLFLMCLVMLFIFRDTIKMVLEKIFPKMVLKKNDK